MMAERGDVARAKAVISEGIAACPPTSSAYLKGTLARYEMIGKPAPAIATRYWFNAPGAKNLDFKGKVTLVEFTNTSCGWCKVGYPSLKRLYTRYGSSGFQPVLVSSLYGDVGGEPATAEKELAYDHKYWVEENGIPFSVAILETGVDTTGGQVRRTTPSAFTDYILTAGYPAYYMVDKNGIVRYVQLGHRGNLEANFARIIERLSREKSGT
jgi:thiol-disulfide isomerase/thioredoxin